RSASWTSRRTRPTRRSSGSPAPRSAAVACRRGASASGRERQRRSRGTKRVLFPTGGAHGRRNITRSIVPAPWFQSATRSRSRDHRVLRSQTTLAPGTEGAREVVGRRVGVRIHPRGPFSPRAFLFLVRPAAVFFAPRYHRPGARR